MPSRSTHIQVKVQRAHKYAHHRYSVFFAFLLLLGLILTLLSVYCHASPALSAGLTAGVYEVCVCSRKVWRKGKVTKGSMCICYSLSGVLLTLQTPHDGFLVNVKRAGATDWFLRHARKALARGYLHSSAGCEVHYIVSRRVCVCVYTAVGGERDNALFKSLLSGDVC